MTLSVGPVGVSNSRPPASQPGAQSSEPPVRGWFVFSRSLNLRVVGTERISQLELKNAFDIFQLVLRKCIPSPCKNRGTCQEDSGSYKCLCLPGFKGSTCEGTSTNAPERGQQIK